MKKKKEELFAYEINIKSKMFVKEEFIQDFLNSFQDEFEFNDKEMHDFLVNGEIKKTHINNRMMAKFEMTINKATLKDCKISK